MRFDRRYISGALAALVVVPLAVPAPAAAATPGHPPAAVAAAGPSTGAGRASSQAYGGGQALGSGQAMYPRVVRLQHNPSLNGRLIASVSASLAGGVTDQAQFLESTDGGVSFHPVGVLNDPQAGSGRGSCCGSLYEVPRQLGALPAGTLLFATSVGLPNAPDRRPEIRVWSSTDGARTWAYRSSCASAPDAPANRGLWEPELSVDARGYLDCYFSDDSRSVTGSYSGFDQTLSVVTSADGGLTWGPVRDVVAIPSTATTTYRPGMAGVRALPNGTYFMSYELCGSGLPDSCEVRYRTSADGWNWGGAQDPGTVARTADGRRFYHAPTVAWAPGGGANGRILLIGGLVKDAAGRLLRPASGATILVNSANGAGRWDAYDAPVTVSFPVSPDQLDIVCDNYSSSLLPATDGTTVLEIATRRRDDGSCGAFFATGTLGSAAGAVALTSGKTYRFGSAQSGLCLDVTGGSADAGVPLEQWTCNALDPQNWKLTDAGGGYFTLTSEQSGKCLDVPSGSKNTGVRVQQWTCNGTNPQLWRAVNVGQNADRLVSKVSGLCLEVADGSTAPGAAVRQSTCTGTDQQSWVPERAQTIMPLGDSITDGLDGTGGYRADLWQLFRTDEQFVDLVGSQYAGPQRLGDRNHEGHPGWRIDQVDAQVSGWLATYRPDTVLLHIGTNDLIQNYSVAQAPTRLSTLIDHITAAAPAAEIYVSTIVPFADAAKEAQVRAYNGQIPGIVAAKAALGRHVHPVDLHAALTPADLLADGVHPTNGGYSKMAQGWYAARSGVPMTRYEAENSANTLVDATTVATANASGDMKVGHLDNAGSYVQFTVPATAAGTVRIYVRAANGTGTPCSHLLSVNGRPGREVGYPSYGWDQWAIAGVDVRLDPGANAIRLAHGSCYAEVDSVDLARGAP